MRRRSFLQLAAGLEATRRLSSALSTTASLPIKRAVEYSMLPTELSIADKMRLARDCGFEQIECPTTPDINEAEEMKKSASAAGLRIHSVMNMDHWKYPLSSSDSAVVERSLTGARTSIRNAHLWGAETVLLVPGVVDANNSYSDVYTRSRESIKKLLPVAEELHVVLAIEEVWNKFLLSPLEFAAYIDSFKSPFIRAYFDVGNVVLYGYPQDWIRTLGKRIIKLHIKDFSFRQDRATGNRVASWVALLEGDIDWLAVYRALHDIDFHGSATVELPPGNAAYLKDVNARFEKILSGHD